MVQVSVFGTVFPNAVLLTSSRESNLALTHPNSPPSQWYEIISGNIFHLPPPDLHGTGNCHYQRFRCAHNRRYCPWCRLESSYTSQNLSLLSKSKHISFRSCRIITMGRMELCMCRPGIASLKYSTGNDFRDQRRDHREWSSLRITGKTDGLYFMKPNYNELTYLNC